MKPPRKRVNPGWYVLAALLFYSVVVTAAWQQSRAALRQARGEQQQLSTQLTRLEGVEAPPGVDAGGGSGGAAFVDEGLWFPVVGAQLPQSTAYWPGAPRSYRQGVNQGFDFYSGDASIPIPYGTPVIASADATVLRADTGYDEPDLATWQALLAEVAAQGTDEDQLDTLRGRQLWLETAGGLVLRYAHLSAIAEGVAEGSEVYRGQVVGFVGNSGTDDGVRGTLQGARLHFEVWTEDGFLGEGMSQADTRERAEALFVGP